MEFNDIKIDYTMREGPSADIMRGATRMSVKVHDHGSVTIVDVMPRLVAAGQTADSAIVQAARVSYGEGTKKISEDVGLIRYLLRHAHTTPFEMVEFKFHCVMPIFVARQWIRHRTANVNEYSARYSIVKDRFYRPEDAAVRQQSAMNKQGGDLIVNDATATDFMKYLDATEASYATYSNLVERGVSRELARIGLPASLYTEWYWKIDLHNLFNFLALRMDEHAQKEIRDYARAMFALIRPIVPVAAEAFLDYRFGSITLSRLEIAAIHDKAPIFSANSREQAEWVAKKERLGL